jgi:hypothetical protein
MTKRILSGALALASVFAVANQAHAANRALFTTDILHRVQNVENGIDNVRVYLSHRLVVRRSTPVDSSTSVDGTVDTVVRTLERKDIIDPESPGKIVGLDSDSTGFHLWVSFDSNCTTRDCAWEFFSDLAIFSLHALPTRDVEGLQVDAMWIVRKPFWRSRMETYPEEVCCADRFNTIGRLAPELMLELKLNELMEVEHKTVRHEGWLN